MPESGTKILTLAPKEYPRQFLVHCSVFTVKAILSAFDFDVHDDPRDYHTSKLVRAIGTSSNAYIVKLLRHNGVEAQLKTAKDLSDSEKLGLLKEMLNRNTPVILSITKRPIGGHFISLWGYDDEEGVFYVYDSAAKQRHLQSDLPIGNRTMTYEEVLRVWPGTILSQHMEQPYQYIEITVPTE